MKRTFAEAMAHRRSYYSIGSDSPVQKPAAQRRYCAADLLLSADC